MANAWQSKADVARELTTRLGLAAWRQFVCQNLCHTASRTTNLITIVVFACEGDLGHFQAKASFECRATISASFALG